LLNLRALLLTLHLVLTSFPRSFFGLGDAILNQLRKAYLCGKVNVRSGLHSQILHRITHCGEHVTIRMRVTDKGAVF
jgi:hypothetical protein